MERRILFVDDQPDILEGLRNLLRRQRRKWDMAFVESGDDAIDRFEQSPFDVIVSDMRMPGMDGASLLERIRDTYPDTVRIILSGHSSSESSVRAISVAHQFLAKPCEPEKLESVVERACKLRELVGDERVQEILGKIDTLPPLPSTYAKLNEVVSSPDHGVREVVEVLEQDMAMAAKILQLANSSFFTTGMEITDIEFAVARLGFSLVKSLTLSAEVFGDASAACEGLSRDALQRHSLLVADLANGILTDKKAKENAFTAGLLHDIGKLVLASQLPDQLEQATGVSQSEGIPLHVAEQRINGTTHAEIGAYLIDLWGLPSNVAEAVANHHAPSRVESSDMDVLAAVHVANVLAHELGGSGNGSSESDSVMLDSAYLAPLAADGQIDTWREMAAEKAELSDVYN